MGNLETEPGDKQKEEYGVLDHRIENGHYVVNIKWKDGAKTESHFPVAGFPVVDPATNKHLGRISGKKALEILQEHAGEYESKKFSWQNFV